MRWWEWNIKIWLYQSSSGDLAETIRFTAYLGYTPSLRMYHVTTLIMPSLVVACSETPRVVCINRTFWWLLSVLRNWYHTKIYQHLLSCSSAISIPKLPRNPQNTFYNNIHISHICTHVHPPTDRLV